MQHYAQKRSVEQDPARKRSKKNSQNPLVQAITPENMDAPDIGRDSATETPKRRLYSKKRKESETNPTPHEPISESSSIEQSEDAAPIALTNQTAMAPIPEKAGPTAVISIRGARTHNLKNVSLDIPRNKFVVITGVSGSGKSSLAFDTIYAEGQRRYVESLSSYARQFLHMMDKPDVDSIDGLSPAISIDQKTQSHNPRSTVGTVTEIYDYIRLFFARIGVPYSPATGLPIEAKTVDQMADYISQMESGEKFYVLAPIAIAKKWEYKKELQSYIQQGFQRAVVDGKVYLLEDVPDLPRGEEHTIAIVVDRLVVPNIDMATGAWQTRVKASIEVTLAITSGVVWIQRVAKNSEDFGEITILSEKFACPVSGFSVEEIEPSLFSFNNPSGACPQCNGLGVESKFDPHQVIDWSLSIKQGAITCLTDEVMSVYRLRHMRSYYQRLMEAMADQFEFSKITQFRNLPEFAQNLILYGSDGIPVPFAIKGRKEYHFNKPFEGVLNILNRRFLEDKSDALHDLMTPWQRTCECAECHGARLSQKALCVKVFKKNIAEVNAMSITEALSWFQSLKFSKKQQKIAEKIVTEICNRLSFLNDVGLNYLTLSRSSSTLSGGESQRIRLASQIGSALTGVLYVLDEPSIGLHQRDNDRLLETIKRLRDLGNSVVVVEHDEDSIKQADWVVDIGIGAGVLGGRVVAQGKLDDVLASKESLTADYLTGRKKIVVPSVRRPINVSNKTIETTRRIVRRWNLDLTESWRGSSNTTNDWGNVPWLRLIGAKRNNLQNISVDIPLGRFVCVTGVSGSGKSTFLECLSTTLAEKLVSDSVDRTFCDELFGAGAIDKIINVDQSPIGRTPRSNAATYIGCFSAIRTWFAGLPESKARGYTPSRFSFNVKGGRCEACQGDGLIKIEMHFLSDVYVECDQCHGRRYNQETLSVKYKEKNISDVLNMSVDEGLTFFDSHMQIWSRLKQLQEVGLGYLSIGHSGTLLSGGEAQRVKLAKELCKKATGHTLYIFDEPTTGLHFEDVRKLIDVLNRLVDQGNSVLVIEHNLDVIKIADWIIDLGPDGGNNGGRIIAEGTPETVAKNGKSFTGKYLKKYLP
ncbi:MAG: excinuclease ABC subunit UvrA [Holosporales bacterium]|jgi:excinuclease ABC subunit A|nr:excinuclease ABC subunit UvrA [Holosporales bacterium]